MERDEILQTLSLHRQELKQFGVKSLALFGSALRGTATPDSDIDILVEFDRPVGLIAFLRLRYRLEEVFGRRVDLATPRSLKRQLKERILKEAVYVE